jgi:ariadne-1
MDDDCYEYEDDTLILSRGISLAEEVKEAPRTNAILFTGLQDYEVFDKQRMENFVREKVRDIIDETGVSEAIAYVALQKKKWIAKKAIQFLKEDYTYDSMEKKTQVMNIFDCPICFSTVKLKDACSLDCDHYFCKDCFSGYLIDCVKDGESCAVKTCPWTGCKEVLTNTIYEKFLKGDLLTKYQKFKVRYLVNSCDYFMWCPAPNCEYVINLQTLVKTDKLVKNLRCNCGNYFCFSCKDEAHRPLSCEIFNKWSALTGGTNSKLNDLWIMKNTKKCPKCKVDIEKNAGCMHMTCRHCKYEWCWICSGDWKQHGSATGGFYACNRYVEDSNANKSDETKELEKLDFYRNRYDDHKKSILQAQNKKTTILKNAEGVLSFMRSLDKGGDLKYSLDDSFLKDALDLIVESRRAVTMTYAFAYYMRFNNSQKLLYEDQQEQLWKLLDGLDEYTDELKSETKLFAKMIDDLGTNQYMVSTKFIDFRADIINKTSSLTKACNQILSYIETDLQKELEKQKELAKLEKLSQPPGLKKQTSVKPKPSKPTSTTGLQTGDHWYCAFCTFANDASKAKCDMCQNNKKVAKNL